MRTDYILCHIVPLFTWVPSWCHGWHSIYVMVRWRGHILHTVPYCAIILHQNRPFPAPGQCGVIVAMMVSLILCHRWHGCHRGVMGDIAYTSWWGGEHIDYILCHCFTPESSFPISRTVWCHRCHDGVIDSLSGPYVTWVPSRCHGWHSIYVMMRWRGHRLHTVPYCAIVLHQNRPFPAPGQCGVIGAMMVSLIPCLCHSWHRGVMGDITYVRHVRWRGHRLHIVPYCAIV